MAFATCISSKLVKASAPVAEDVSTFRMFHPSKGQVTADSRSAQSYEKQGYTRHPVTPAQGPKKKG